MISEVNTTLARLNDKIIIGNCKVLQAMVMQKLDLSGIGKFRFLVHGVKILFCISFSNYDVK